MRIRLSVAALLVCVAGLSLAAQAKPDFSGVWTLVPDRSDFGQMPAPTKMTRTITHKDPAITIVTVQSAAETGDTNTTTVLSTDGKPHQNTVSGSPMTTTGRWDGASIVFHSALSMQGTPVTIDDRYTLSDAGRTLTLVRTFTSADGTAAARIVMTKQ